MKTASFNAWQFPAMELANLSAMPSWLAGRSSTGSKGLYVDRVPGRPTTTIVAQPGDWLVLMPNDEVMRVSAEDFAESWEVAP